MARDGSTHRAPRSLGIPAASGLLAPMGARSQFPRTGGDAPGRVSRRVGVSGEVRGTFRCEFGVLSRSSLLALRCSVGCDPREEGFIIPS